LEFSFGSFHRNRSVIVDVDLDLIRNLDGFISDS